MNHAQSIPVALIARTPVVAQVKQRLAQEIGDDESLQCYQKLLQSTLVATGRFPTTIWYEGSIEAWAHLAPGRELREQPDGDLGYRMYTALAEGAKLVIGADIPLMCAAYLEQATDYLASSYDLVIGPVEDGGYCLIGMNDPVEQLFRNISWGSEQVLKQTLSCAHNLGMRTAMLPMLWDVDTVEDYLRWKREVPQTYAT